MLTSLKSALAGAIALAALVATGDFSPARAQLQSFSKVYSGGAYNATLTFGVSFSQFVPPPPLPT